MHFKKHCTRCRTWQITSWQCRSITRHVPLWRYLLDESWSVNRDCGGVFPQETTSWRSSLSPRDWEISIMESRVAELGTKPPSKSALKCKYHMSHCITLKPPSKSDLKLKLHNSCVQPKLYFIKSNFSVIKPDSNIIPVFYWIQILKK